MCISVTHKEVIYHWIWIRKWLLSLLKLWKRDTKICAQYVTYLYKHSIIRQTIYNKRAQRWQYSKFIYLEYLGIAVVSTNDKYIYIYIRRNKSGRYFRFMSEMREKRICASSFFIHCLSHALCMQIGISIVYFVLLRLFTSIYVIWILNTKALLVWLKVPSNNIYCIVTTAMQLIGLGVGFQELEEKFIYLFNIYIRQIIAQFPILNLICFM